MEPLPSFSGAAPLISPDQTRETFKVFVGFDSAAAKAEALSTAQFVHNQMADEFEMTLNAWDIAYLGAPRLRNIAAREATAADMIIICSRENQTGLDDLKSWISKWKHQRKKGAALLALIYNQAGHRDSAIFSLLQKTAESTQMDFIAKSCKKVEG